jgi:hypothetical protein
MEGLGIWKFRIGNVQAPLRDGVGWLRAGTGIASPGIGGPVHRQQNHHFIFVLFCAPMLIQGVDRFLATILISCLSSKQPV